MNVYLDNAATVPLSSSTEEYLTDILKCYGNPSSLHSIGKKSKEIIVQTRIAVADFINANISDLYFTCSGSAANTLAIRGYYMKNNCCILYTPIAHKSIINCVNSYKYSFPLKVNKDGIINIDDIKEWLDTHEINPFIIIDYANSEIGTVQNVKEIIDLVHFYNGYVYLDCTGSISTIPLDVKKLNVDMAGFSAHKLGGLKGCGILYKKPGIQLEPLIYGNQENGLIGGTENVLGIASLYNAVINYDYSIVSSHNRDLVYKYMKENISDCYLIGSDVYRLPNNLYMCFRAVDGETLMLNLDMHGIQVSTGSACNSQNIEPSYVLTALNVNKDDINSCIRMSFSGHESKKELEYVCHTLKNCVDRIRNMS